MVLSVLKAPLPEAACSPMQHSRQCRENVLTVEVGLLDNLRPVDDERPILLLTQVTAEDAMSQECRDVLPVGLALIFEGGKCLFQAGNVLLSRGFVLLCLLGIVDEHKAPRLGYAQLLPKFSQKVRATHRGAPHELMRALLAERALGLGWRGHPSGERNCKYSLQVTLKPRYRTHRFDQKYGRPPPWRSGPLGPRCYVLWASCT